MQEAGFVADMFCDICEECDDVMLHFAFNGVDTVNFKSAALAHGLGDAFWDEAEVFHGLGGEGFDLEPDAETRFRRPDFSHFGSCISRDHVVPHCLKRPYSPESTECQCHCDARAESRPGRTGWPVPEW